MIDAHVHLIDLQRHPMVPGKGYVAQPDEAGTLPMLLDLMDRHGIAGAVLVQPSGYGEDNTAMLEALAAEPGRFKVVVQASGAELDRLGRMDEIVGLRLNTTHSVDRTYGLQAVREALSAAESAGLVCEILAPPHLLAAADDDITAAACPVVLDHMGLPDIEDGLEAFRTVLALARSDTVLVKLSAPFRKATPPFARLRPFTDALLDAFGADRCLWGSDWPFINLPDRPAPDYGALVDWGRSLRPAQQDAIMGGTARRLFGFAPHAGS